jgi:hypothetical protein
VTPPGASSASKHRLDAQLPLQLQHNISWEEDAAAALNAAAGTAHASGGDWMFVAVAGDTVMVQDAGLVLQQLQESCAGEQALACHSGLQDPAAKVRTDSVLQQAVQIECLGVYSCARSFLVNRNEQW